MPENDADQALPAAPREIAWVRKRDGSVVAFDPARLSGSIYSARAQVSPDNAAFDAQELSHAVLHFLLQEFEGRIPTTDEISECVINVLREIGQGPTAQIYHDYQQQRAARRERVRVYDDAQVPTPDLVQRLDFRSAESWSKARIANLVETQSDVDARTAREIAAAVERKLLACGWRRISHSLLWECIDCELLERGMLHRWRGRRPLGVSVDALSSSLASGQDASDVLRWAGRELVRQFALSEVFSPDLAGLHQDGLLHLFEAWCPTQWSVVSIDVRRLAARCRDAETFLHEFELALEVSGRSAGGTVVIDAPEIALAFAAESSAEPELAAADWVASLSRVLRRQSIGAVVNLYGRAPGGQPAGGVIGEPLFERAPEERHDSFAGDAACAIAHLLLRESSIASHCRIDLHLPSRDRLSTTNALRRWLRFLHRGPQIRVCFDRDRLPLAEGLVAGPGTRPAVVQYVGIHLPRIYEQMGRAADDDSLLERIALLCGSAVRAGVQKREFLRKHQPELAGTHEPATLVVVPIGLDALVAGLLGKPMAADDAALAMGEQILARTWHRLRREGRHYHLACVLDGIPHLCLESEQWQGTLDDPTWVIGNTPALPGPGPRQQIRAGARLHAVVGAGTTQCRLPHDQHDPDQLFELVQFAASENKTCRLTFISSAPRQPPLVKEWMR
jgi:hypothetical protein